jgi:CheY-like chemotaxis protein
MAASPGSSNGGLPRVSDFQDLMRYRIMDVLLVSAPYDAFLLEEVGELEQTLGELRNLDLHYAPGLIGASTGASALELARRQKNLDLIISTPHAGDMSAAELARGIRDAGIEIPLVLLAWDASELNGLADDPGSGIERAFLWQGDARILLAILKSVEDWRNVAHDTASVGVQVILLIEDNVRNYSSFLPLMYKELLHQSQRVSLEGLNTSQKILRMRARPKILLCTHFAEAERAFRDHGDQVLGIISDVEFPRERGGRPLLRAGADFAEMVRKIHPDIPIVLHSSKPENRRLARELGTSFLLKGLHRGSPTVLQELREVMLRDFGFGDFVFRCHPDGPEVDRAGDLHSLEEKLRVIPEESLIFHSARNHFSRWLKARTEFPLAHALRPRTVADYPSPRALREDMIDSIAGYRRDRSQTVVALFDSASFDFSTDFYRIGDGSLGGKARGLAFVRRLLSLHGLRRRFPGVEICVPPAVVLATGAFERFLDQNGLRRFAVEQEDDAEIQRRFEAAAFPDEAARDVRTFLERATYPLSVRSSSLLEDSRHQPFTGVYDTLMLRNNAESLDERVGQALLAIRRVYASMFSRAAKTYLLATSHSPEEEKMAVILQKIVGAAHGPRYYPDFSGVARSYNFYPSPPMTAREGVTAVALGLGRAIVEGGACLRFCPRHPQHVAQLASVADVLGSTQHDFWALSLIGEEGDDLEMREEAFGLEVAERDGTLAAVGSTYSPENDVVVDGLARQGTRVVTFAPILKHGLFPLAEVLQALTEVGEEGMGTPVEIELAVNLSVPRGRPKELGVLQMRPLALARESEAIEIGDVEPVALLCRSRQVLGNGRLEGIRDLVVVDFKRFERARSRQAAAEIGRLNGQLLARSTPYILIGVGRWGSRDPWLGLPVTWDQVAGAKVIVESGLRDLDVTPSQGSHFFQNLTAFNVGYFTIGPAHGFVDWDWLDAQPDASHEAHVRHIRLDRPVLVKMNGRTGEGAIVKPEV